MSCCGSCDLYWPEGKENYGITCPGDQCQEECVSNLQSLISQLRTAMETPKEYPINGQMNMFHHQYIKKETNDD